jgi:FkbM family methyltransferase
LSWTLDFIRQQRVYYTLPSAWRLRSLALRTNAGALRPDAYLHLNMKHPVSAEFTIRECGSDMTTVQEILFDRVYGPLGDQLDHCRTIIDLGANIGLASLHFSIMFPESRILAVEPEKSNFDLLERNLGALVRAGRCRTLRAAAWNTDGTVGIEPHEGNFFWGFHVNPAPNPVEQVSALSMNSILSRSGFDTVDLLKIDVEGAEVEIFQGDLSWVPRVRAMAIEFHGDSLDRIPLGTIMPNYRITPLNDHTVLARAV